MPKLGKNYYNLGNGERRINCYMVNIPKRLVESTNIEEDDEIMIYAKDNRIIIQKGNDFNTKGIIRNEELDKMLEEEGKRYVLTMYANRKFNMTSKQLDYVLEYKGNNNG